MPRGGSGPPPLWIGAGRAGGTMAKGAKVLMQLEVVRSEMVQIRSIDQIGGSRLQVTGRDGNGVMMCGAVTNYKVEAGKTYEILIREVS